MTRRIVLAAVATIALLFGMAGTAHAQQTQQFRGDGSSDFGFAYDYAVADALNKAEAAGYTPDECAVIFRFGSPYSVTVVMECTR
jgi:hypothetical protein